jgi:hypothetical protein
MTALSADTFRTDRVAIHVARDSGLAGNNNSKTLLNASSQALAWAMDHRSS